MIRGLAVAAFLGLADLAPVAAQAGVADAVIPPCEASSAGAALSVTEGAGCSGSEPSALGGSDQLTTCPLS